MATSVPVPMARPRSAWASAAASLTPSPTMATTLPSACSSAMTSTLSCGQHLGDHLVDADLGGDLVGDGRVVAGQQHRGQAEGAQLLRWPRAGRLDRVGHDEHAAGLAVPADDDGGPARAPRRPPWRVRGRLGGAATSRRAASARPTSTAWPSHDALDAHALDVGEVLDRRQRADLLGRALGDRLGDRVLGGVLEGAGQPQQLVAVDAVGTVHVERGSSGRW